MFKFQIFACAPPACASLFMVARVVTIVLSVAAVWPLVAHAGRPMTTDDAAIVDGCQLEAWWEGARQQGADRDTFWLNPACNPFGTTEFALGAAREHDAEGAAMLAAWQIKHLWRAYGDTRAGYAVALRGAYDSRHDGLFDDVGVSGILTLPLHGEAWLAHANLGARRMRDHDRWRVHVVWGLGLDRQVAPATRLAAEVFDTVDRGMGWQLGIRHERVAGRVQLDASVGAPDGRFSGRVYTVGLVFAVPSFLR